MLALTSRPVTLFFTFFAGLLLEQAVQASSARAKVLQTEVWQESVAMAQQNPSLNITPIFAQALGTLGDLNEERLATSLASELDSPRTGFIRIGQQSMERLQLDLRNGAAENQ